MPTRSSRSPALGFVGGVGGREKLEEENESFRACLSLRLTFYGGCGPRVGTGRPPLSAACTLLFFLVCRQETGAVSRMKGEGVGHPVTSLPPTSPSVGCPGVLSADVTLGLRGVFSPSAHSTSALTDLSVGQSSWDVRRHPPTGGRPQCCRLRAGDPVPTRELSFTWPPHFRGPCPQEAVGVWLPLVGQEGP